MTFCTILASVSSKRAISLSWNDSPVWLMGNDVAQSLLVILGPLLTPRWKSDR